MQIPHDYEGPGPTREAVDALVGKVVLEFGANGCGFCAAAQPPIAAAFADYPDMAYFKVADGPGRPLGRSFRVKLWPTLIVLKDGRELARVVRPTSPDAVRECLATGPRG